MKSLLMALLFAAGCMVGDPVPTGGGGGAGGGGAGSGAMIDAGGSGGGGGSAAACTNALYDPCTDASQCTSGTCQLFSGAGIQVCTQSCTPGDDTTCPPQNGEPVTCNNKGICKPSAANSCTR